MVVVQISDPHLRPEGELYGGAVDSNAMLATALRQIAALDPPPDAVIVTGDIVDEGRAEDYAVARSMLAEVGPPLLVLPGNHDDRERFRAAFADRVDLPAAGPLHWVREDLEPLRIVGLDVTVPGAHHGCVDEDAAEWLEAALARDPGRPTLLAMHQPPLVVGVPYLDAYRCHGAARLAAVLARYPAVERVLCGHVHRLTMVRFASTLLCTAPSTATAIALRFHEDAEPASHVEPPGFLLHRWTARTGVVTHLVPIGTFPGPLPFA